MLSSLSKKILAIILVLNCTYTPTYTMENINSDFIKELAIAETIGLSAAALIYTAYHAYTNPEDPWYINQLTYPVLTCLSDICYSIRSRILFSQLHHSGLTKTQQIEWIQKQLSTIKQNALSKEEKITNAILKEASIDPVSYQKNSLDPFLQLCKKIRTTKQVKTTHDEHLDSFTLDTTKKMLLAYGLNPDCYSITELTTELTTKLNKNNNMETHAAYTTGDYEFYQTGNLIHDVTIFEEPSIRFNLKSYEITTQHVKHAIIAHETTHAYLLHPERRSRLSKLTNQQNPLLNTIKTIHEEQADIFPSIDSATISTCMRVYRKKGCYPPHMYLDHYNNLCTIDELHKVIHWIKTAPTQTPTKYAPSTKYQPTQQKAITFHESFVAHKE